MFHALLEPLFGRLTTVVLQLTMSPIEQFVQDQFSHSLGQELSVGSVGFFAASLRGQLALSAYRLPLPVSVNDQTNPPTQPSPMNQAPAVAVSVPAGANR